jgi:hypothetical protein
MESAISLISGQAVIFAENVDYGDCERNQIVCPECLEPLFKKLREKGAKARLATHFFCHYPSPGAECSLRVKGEAQDFQAIAGADAYGQSIEAFEAQFKRLVSRGAMKLRPDKARVASLLSDAWDSLRTTEEKRGHDFTIPLSGSALEALDTLRGVSATTPIGSALDRSQTVQRFLRAPSGRHCSLLAGSAALVVLFGGAFTTWRPLFAHARSQDVEELQRDIAPVFAGLVVLYVNPRLEPDQLIQFLRRELSRRRRGRAHGTHGEVEDVNACSAENREVVDSRSGSALQWRGNELTWPKIRDNIEGTSSGSDYETYQAESGIPLPTVVTWKRSTATVRAGKIVCSVRPSSMSPSTGTQSLRSASPAPASHITYDEWVEVEGSSIDVERLQHAKQVYSCTRCNVMGVLRPVLGLPAPYAGSNGTPTSVLPSWCRHCDGPAYGRYPPTTTAADEKWQYCTLPDAFRGLVGCSDPRRLWYSTMPKPYADTRVARLQAVSSSVAMTEPACLECGSSAIEPLTLNEGSSSVGHSCGGQIIGRFHRA